MDEVKFIEYKGIKILFIHFPDNVSKDKFLEIVDTVKEVVRNFDEETLYTLTLVGKFHYDKEMTKSVQMMVQEDKPFIHAAAIVGVRSFLKIIANTAMVLAGRRFRVFDTVDLAKEYLYQEASKNLVD